jgi:hypothetical protein
MKKITLVLFTFLAFQWGNAQQTISFETSESYTLGNINAQNSWATTGTGPGTFIANQVITTESATDGTNSLKITQETAFPGQMNPVVGAFYNYAALIPGSNAVFSADMFISQQDANSSDFIFGLVNTVAGSFRTYVRFTFEGNIVVLAVDGLGTVVLDDTDVDWSPNTWYNVKIELVANTISISLDGTVIYTGIPATAGDVNQVRFAHDNFEGFAYIDNFRTNDEPTASVDEFENNTFKHFYNKDTDVLTMTSSTLAFDNVELYNLLGQQVLNRSLSQTNETVNMASLEDGIYLAKVSIQGRTQTVKILKN